jgi:uncharacterized membrane protein YcaP (DUF421 family)
METVLKAAVVYLIVWAAIRISGRRTLAEMTAFDFVLFLLIGGAVHRALTGQDYSLTNAFLIITTLIGIDVVLSFFRRDWPGAAKIIKGVATIVVEDGQPLPWRMRRSRVTIDDVLAAARHNHGLENLQQIKFAILEASGDISIIPYDRRLAAPA